MDYKSFDVKEDAEINDFLKLHSHGLAGNSVRFHEGKLCFLYINKTAEQITTDSLVEAIEANMHQKKLDLCAIELNVRMANALALRAVPGAESNVIAYESQRREKQDEIGYLEQIKEEVKSGKWTETILKKR